MVRIMRMNVAVVVLGWLFALAPAVGQSTGADTPRAEPKPPEVTADGRTIEFGVLRFVQQRSFSADTERMDVALQDGTTLRLEKGCSLTVSEFAPSTPSGRALDFVNLFTGNVVVRCAADASVVMGVGPDTLSADGGEYEVFLGKAGWTAKCVNGRLHALHADTNMAWHQDEGQWVKVEPESIGFLFTNDVRGEGLVVFTLPPPNRPRRRGEKQPAEDALASARRPGKQNLEDIPLLIAVDPGEAVYIEKVGKSLVHWPWRPSRLWLPELVTVGGRELVYQDNLVGDRFLIYADVGDLELTLPGGRKTALFERSSLLFPVLVLPGLPTGALPEQKRRHRLRRDLKNTGVGPRPGEEPIDGPHIIVSPFR